MPESANVSADSRGDCGICRGCTLGGPCIGWPEEPKPTWQQEGSQSMSFRLVLEEEIRTRVHALRFDADGLDNEVARLRRALGRIYYCIPAGNAPTEVEAAILAVYQHYELEPLGEEPLLDD